MSSQPANGRLSLFLDFKSDGRWTAGAYALNVTDKQVRANVVVDSAVLGSIAEAAYEPGRQVGASLSYHF